ncbi:MAG: hypothetical protein DRQ55_10145 [Planctomycetota bacterium]|nr:MAG: hypothetical protein DRQ55_10145 [Planctomycetota bacterium]
MTRHWRLLALLALAAFCLPGCLFHRTRSNEHVLDLDTASIRVGQTTWSEVLDTLGPPAVANQNEDIGTYLSERHLLYRVTDSRDLTLIIPPVAVLPFMRWADTEEYHELLITFDEDGVVDGVFVEEVGSIWELTQDEEDRHRVPVRSLGGTS